MTTDAPIIGYFVWRKTNRDVITCEKVLKYHVDHWMAANKMLYNSYMWNQLAVHPLNDVEWGYSLKHLANAHPYVYCF